MPNPRPLLHTATGLAILANSSPGHAASTHHAPAPTPLQLSTPRLLGAQNSLAPAQTALGEFTAHFDGILGTSCDLVLHTLEPAAALHCQEIVLSEIERLRGILSTYDPASEIRRVMAGAPVRSPELAAVLAAYDTWSARTGGAIDINLSQVIAAWKTAGKSGFAPTEAILRTAFSAPRAYNIDALGKGYIIDRAVALARQIVPAGLLDIGGDIRVWGGTNWAIGIADPANPAENVAPVATFTLSDAAVATSGGYARNFTISSQCHSHLISPLDLQPLHPLAAATVVASDCVTANALSSAACVLGSAKGATLAKTFAAAHYINDAFTQQIAATRTFFTSVLVGVDTGQRSTPAVVAAPSSTAATGTPAAAISQSGTSSGTTAKPATTDAPAASAPWPKGFQVTVNLNLGTAQTMRGTRPYVAIWIVNDKNATVRTVDVWGRQPKYWPELTYWWSDPRNRGNFALNLTRATRPAGKYSVVWDGKDDKGNALPQGQYTVVLEINREHGSHAKQTIVLNCADSAADGVLKATTESGESPVHYGPPELPAAAKPGTATAPVATSSITSRPVIPLPVGAAPAK